MGKAKTEEEARAAAHDEVFMDACAQLTWAKAENTKLQERIVELEQQMEEATGRAGPDLTARVSVSTSHAPAPSTPPVGTLANGTALPAGGTLPEPVECRWCGKSACSCPSDSVSEEELRSLDTQLSGNGWLDPPTGRRLIADLRRTRKRSEYNRKQIHAVRVNCEAEYNKLCDDIVDRLRSRTPGRKCKNNGCVCNACADRRESVAEIEDLRTKLTEAEANYDGAVEKFDDCRAAIARVVECFDGNPHDSDERDWHVKLINDCDRLTLAAKAQLVSKDRHD